jgi:hypothetical protein
MVVLTSRAIRTFIKLMLRSGKVMVLSKCFMQMIQNRIVYSGYVLFSIGLSLYPT